MIRRTRQMLRIAAVALAWACTTTAQPRTVDETSVHAAYAINFLRYARWPGTDAGGPLVVAVVGSAQTAATFRTLARNAGPVNGRPIAVRAVPVNVAAPDRREAAEALRSPLRGAHLVYVAPSHDAWQRAVVDVAAGQPTLTVGTGDEFVARGGMFGFHHDRGRVRFEADPSRIAAARIDMSAHVLKLARSPGAD